MRSLTSRLTLTLVCLGASLTPAAAQQTDKSAENAKMAWEFHRAVASDSGNSLISPYSITSVFGVLSLGARGQTLTELRKVLHHKQAMSVENAAVSLAERKMAQSAAKDGVDLVLSNALLIAKNTKIRDEFSAAAANSYRSEILNTLAGLEAWMSRATKGKLAWAPDKEMEQDEFAALNAVYFKAKFENPFEKDDTLQRAEFSLPNGLKVQIPLMTKTDSYAIAAGEGFRRLRLPYKGGSFSLEILLPDEGRTLAQAEQSTTPEAFAKLLALPLKTESTRVYIPRFKINSDYNLAQKLAAMGLNSLATDGKADFSGIGGAPGMFKMTSAKQIAQIEVDEVGTEAIVITSAGAGFGGAPAKPLEFRADRPFLFVLRTNDIILFIGRVENPHPAAR